MPTCDSELNRRPLDTRISPNRFFAVSKEAAILPGENFSNGIRLLAVARYLMVHRNLPLRAKV